MANCNYKVNLTDIQNKYKFKIFNTGSYNDSDLRKMIESVFYALPRTTGSGTSVTLTDTAFSYMKNKLYATDTSQNGTPTPDYPQVIHTINGDNTVKVCGKNLIPFINQDFTLNGLKYYVDNGNLYVDGTSSGETYSTNASFKNNFNFTLPAGTYTLQRNNNVATYIDNKATGTHLVINSGSFTLNETTEVNLGFYVYQLSFTNQQFKVQLEKGSTATTYEPYQSNSVLLTLGDKEICKIGNYEDKIFKAIKGNEIYDSLASEEKATLDYGKWYLRKNIGKVVFNGSETFGIDSTTANRTAIYSPPIDNIISYTLASETPLLLCSHFTPMSQSATWAPGYIARRTLVSSVYFLVEPNTTTEAFKTWLGTHNVEVLYPLATPTNELFNDTIQDQLEDIYNNMLSYEGQTNVSQVNDDLPFNINSTALKDLNNL